MLTQSAHWMNYFNERRGIKKTNAMHGNVNTSFTWSDWAYEPLEADYIITQQTKNRVHILWGMLLLVFNVGEVELRQLLRYAGLDNILANERD